MSPRDDRDIRASVNMPDRLSAPATVTDYGGDGVASAPSTPAPPQVADRPQRTEAELEAAARRLINDHGHRGAVLQPDGSRLEWALTCDSSGWAAHADGLTSIKHPTALAAAVELLKAHPEFWPAEPEPQPGPLREAVREALRLLVWAEHHGDEDDNGGCCWVCDDPWPCDVEQAHRRLAAALDAHDPKEDR